MKTLPILAAAMLAGCGSPQFAQMFPQTAAGWDAGGVLGALDGATGAVLVRCRTLDGDVVRIAVDDVAASFGTDVDHIRMIRQQACGRIGALDLLGDVLLAPPPAAGMAAPVPEG